VDELDEGAEAVRSGGGGAADEDEVVALGAAGFVAAAVVAVAEVVPVEEDDVAIGWVVVPLTDDCFDEESVASVSSDWDAWATRFMVDIRDNCRPYRRKEVWVEVEVGGRLGK
jgi:hypothetical protein